jgi:hypothetical protein
MIDKKICIWFLVAGLAVITGGYLFGKILIPGYTVHKAHAITYFLFGLAMWRVPTKLIWFNRIARFLIIIAINNIIDEFWGDPYSTQPIEYVLGVFAVLSIFPTRMWYKKQAGWKSSKNSASR